MNKLSRFSIIFAQTWNGGIGYKNNIPWPRIEKDMSMFAATTIDSFVIMGRKTYDSLPEKNRPLKNRTNIVISRIKTESDFPDGVYVFNHIIKALYFCQTEDSLKKVMVIGGAEIINYCLKEIPFLIVRVILTEIEQSYACDTFVDQQLLSKVLHKYFYDMRIIHQSVDNDSKYSIAEHLFVNYLSDYKKYRKCGEMNYHHMLKKLVYKTDIPFRDNRTGVPTKSLFGAQMKYDISNGRVAVITTKKVLIDSVIGELQWMLKGETTLDFLHEKNIHFWDANASKEFLEKRSLPYEEGELGPVYGHQWRHWGSNVYDRKYFLGDDQIDQIDKGIDQIANVIDLLKNDPFSRRIILSAWNVGDLDKMALPPCHMLVQWYVGSDEETGLPRYLDIKLYQRSGDIFLGVPFNMVFYSVLNHLLAKQVGLESRYFYHTFGDLHLYETHVEAAKEQLSHTIKPFPTIQFYSEDEDEEDNNKDMIGRFIDGTLKYKINDYFPAKFIKAPMAV